MYTFPSSQVASEKNTSPKCGRHSAIQPRAFVMSSPGMVSSLHMLTSRVKVAGDFPWISMDPTHIMAKIPIV